MRRTADGTMTNSRRRTSATVLSRDLLNLALVLAFLHVDPEAYLGLNHDHFMPTSSSHKILDDLSALGRYNGHIYPQHVEISAYILNSAETLQNSAVNFLNQSHHQQNNEEGNFAHNTMDYDDSGVSDVDSNFSASGSSGASPPHLRDLEEDVKVEDSNDYSAMFDSNESSNIFRDLDDILESEIKVEEEQEYAPDEEDVENQLMHIDDQLIRLDENIEDISGHLDEQLLNSSAGNLGIAENLLTQEEEIFLFESMPEVINPLHGWQLDDDVQIDDLIAAGLPSPLMPSPFEDRDDIEKPKTVEQQHPVKQEQPEHLDEEQLYTEEIDQYNWLLSPTDSLASTSLIPNDLIKKEEDEAAAASSHLVDHNYAMSSFDECFGGDLTPPSTSSSSYKSELNFNYLGGASALSPAPSSVGSHSRESRDERKARELNLPFRVSEIIDLPIDAFNDLVASRTLTEEQLVLCRDIRRRGKNKVAAQNCRKRKMDLISQLEEEVNRARHQKQVLLAEREELYRLRTEWTHKLMNLESTVLQGLSKNSNDYTLDYSGATVKVTARLAKPTKA